MGWSGDYHERRRARGRGGRRSSRKVHASRGRGRGTEREVRRIHNRSRSRSFPRQNTAWACNQIKKNNLAKLWIGRQGSSTGNGAEGCSGNKTKNTFHKKQHTTLSKPSEHNLRSTHFARTKVTKYCNHKPNHNHLNCTT